MFATKFGIFDGPEIFFWIVVAYVALVTFVVMTPLGGVVDRCLAYALQIFDKKSKQDA